ncbi:hypothetical protein [Candidatus Borrarchaeum sp.]|uniref:hypothetical protein n=1 Tax=Candidatus Borrarchaeum sp. TaxID=2846742 RepID=UPI00257AD999|nr:hypothetical protein [Candidatus Borrarchaeum sp.]
MSMKDWEKDIKELTVLGKEFFGKTQVLLTKITKELEKEAANRVNELKVNFDKFMKVLLKAEVTKTAA